MERIRIDQDGPSPLQQLKGLPPEEQEFLVAQRQGKKPIPVAKLIAQIEARHGIYGLTPPRWSDFFRWFTEQREIRSANETVANIREIFSEVMPSASAEETHKFLVNFLTAQGFAQGSEKALRFATVETRKSIEVSQKDRRIRLLEQNQASVKEKLEAVKSKGGLSPETLATIEEATRLL